MFTTVNKFRELVIAEINALGWSQSDLARAAGVSKSSISMALNEDRQPGTELCLGIAHALKKPPEEVYRWAGLLPPAPGQNPTIEQINYVTAGLPPDEQENILEYALLRRRIAEEKGTYDAARPSQPRPATPGS